MSQMFHTCDITSIFRRFSGIASRFPRALAPHMALTLLCLLMLGGCGYGISSRGDMSFPLQIQYNDWVSFSPLQISVQPNATPDHAPKALMVPLRCTQEIAYPDSISRNLTRSIWQEWLSLRPFSVLEYDSQAPLFRPETAIALAKRKGAELVVGGYITHYMDGGSVGDSTASIQIEIYEVATGNMLWSMAQAGQMEKNRAADFYFLAVKPILPADAAAFIIQGLAHNMGKKVADWSNRVKEKSTGQKMKDAVGIDGKAF